jgi:hypothetical protein
VKKDRAKPGEDHSFNNDAGETGYDPKDYVCHGADGVVRNRRGPGQQDEQGGGGRVRCCGDKDHKNKSPSCSNEQQRSHYSSEHKGHSIGSAKPPSVISTSNESDPNGYARPRKAISKPVTRDREPRVCSQTYGGDS